ncbi:HAMP domain-containing histidine kinase [Candidatus Daviesbacteria bacterium]|nr:HAMP domain-containing histidine kinase [Candidatus Daviesbacteria bacterium]
MKFNIKLGEFTKARLKLTAFYILIIALISILFSVAFYKASTKELERIRHIQAYRLEHPEEFFLSFPDGPRVRINPDTFNLQSIDDAEARIALSLGVINLSILIISALAGYFLAGRTLKPIKEMLDEQNRFITDSSHELRTPLTSLRSEIEVNLRDKNLKLENAKKLLESNLEEVNNLQILSDNLIKLTQYQKQNGNVKFTEDVSLKEVLEEAVKKVNKLAKQKNINIETHFQDIKLKADKQSLSEVFVILLDNAIKYSPKNKLIKLSAKKIDHSIQIVVKDQGIGIDQKDIPHLFDRFYRADRSRTKNNTPGYGLGLSIAKQIIEKHKGTIKVESTLGKETTFYIQLPLG